MIFILYELLRNFMKRGSRELRIFSSFYTFVDYSVVLLSLFCCFILLAL
jgi:hypothetical protein